MKLKWTRTDGGRQEVNLSVGHGRSRSRTWGRSGQRRSQRTRKGLNPVLVWGGRRKTFGREKEEKRTREALFNARIRKGKGPQSQSQ